MTDKLQTQKDSLAKLMATENLTIVHRKVPTAYFDIQNRLLCCPILKDELSPELYDLFMGHEVGHALHTPLEGLHSTLKENRTLKGYLNVVEDVRIERKIKEKYQGLRKSFFKAYNELIEKDFFGIKGRNLQELSLIDKINLITKCGSRVQISLTDEEQVFLDMAEACETWEDVVECATAIYEWSKENETRDENDLSISSYEYDADDFEDEDEDDEDLFEDDYSDSDEDYEDNLPDINDGNDTSAEELEKEDYDLEEEQTKKTGSNVEDNSGGLGYDDESGAKEALTEYNAHNNEKDFVSDTNSPTYQIDLKSIYNSEYIRKDHFLVSYKNSIEEFRKHWSEKGDQKADYYTDSYLIKDGLELAKITANKIASKNRKIINHMAKEFEMKQSAKRSAKAFTGKTGQLDMNRLAKYQIVEDVFKRAVYLPDGKNHGITVLLDWSGSISNQVCDLLEQTIILAEFCRKVQIPHRMYLFSDTFQDERGYGDDSADRIVELFSNEMTTRQYKEMYTYVCALWNHFRFNSHNWRGYEKFFATWREWFGESYRNEEENYISVPRFLPYKWELGGTPLDSSLVYMRKLLPEFNKKYSIEKSILTIITDGESHQSKFLDDHVQKELQLDEQDADSYEGRWNAVKEIIDPYNRRVYKLGAKNYRHSNFSQTQNILEWITDTTGVIVTGYFVLSRKGDLYNVLNYVEQDRDATYDDTWKEIRKEGKVFKSKGYNKLFLTASTTLSVEGDDTLDDSLIDAKKGRLSQAFRKNQRSKSTSRFLTNEFIKEIA